MVTNYSNSEQVIAIRGATTSYGNSYEEIENAVKELIDELVARNKLDLDKVISITFTVTKDLDACFPAAIARKYYGLDKVAFLDCQQMYVSNDIDYCINNPSNRLNNKSSLFEKSFKLASR